MELSANKSQNKENNNPVLVPTQYEIMQKKVSLPKPNHPPSQILLQKTKAIGRLTYSESHHRPFQQFLIHLQGHREDRQTITISAYLNHDSIQLHPASQRKTPNLIFQSPNQQVTEVLEMFDKENLMKIQQIKPYTPRRPLAQYLNSKLPALNQDNASNDQENSEKATPLLKNKLLFRRTINPSLDKIKRNTQPEVEVRHKRVISQILSHPVNQNQPKNLNAKLNKVLKNKNKIMSICNKIPNIQELIGEEQLSDLINSDQFKIEFQHFINNSQGSPQDMEQILQNFMIDQIRKTKELQEAETNLKEKGRFSRDL